ncbi:alpha/beta fold hydrolase [Pseudomonas sp. ES4]|uniref:alpha/beta fold hydrolase n=1 Tax=Pseudomonas sp. ES4 TaxID=3424777 RepID=UPI003D32A1DA
MKAITAWGNQAPQDLERLRTPTLIVNGDNDIMVPSENSLTLANRVPNAQLVIYEDAGHGGIFQNYADFVAKALAFLDA